MNSVTKQFLTDTKNGWTKTVLTKKIINRQINGYTHKKINVEIGQTERQTELKTIP